MKKIIPLVLTLLLLSAATSAQTKPKFSTAVRLNVSGEPEIKGALVSHLSREFRAIDGVVLDDERYRWEVRVVAMKLMPGSGSDTGYALSVIIAERLYASTAMAITHCQNADKEILEKVLDGVGRIENHYLMTGSISDLPRLVKEIATNFDGDQVEPSRRRYKSRYGK